MNRRDFLKRTAIIPVVSIVGIGAVLSETQPNLISLDVANIPDKMKLSDILEYWRKHKVLLYNKSNKRNTEFTNLSEIWTR